MERMTKRIRTAGGRERGREIKGEKMQEKRDRQLQISRSIRPDRFLRGPPTSRLHKQRTHTREEKDSYSMFSINTHTHSHSNRHSGWANRSIRTLPQRTK